MAYKPNAYLQQALEQQNLAADEAMKKYQAQSDLAKQQALATQKAAVKTAKNDYYNYINPYGLQAEALAKSGLSNSGLSQTSLSKGWTNYQNAKGQANTAYQNSLNELDTNLIGYQADINAQKASNMGDYYSNLYNDYIANRDYEYQLSRDKIEDERYKKEFPYRFSSGSGGGSSSSSSSKKSTKKSSINTEDAFEGAEAKAAVGGTANSKTSSNTSSKNKKKPWYETFSWWNY